MARAPRDARLETREARGRLSARHEPYWRQIHDGLFLGYRKTKGGGSWHVRTYEGGKYRKRKLALADDNADADGVSVLSYRQAMEKAMEGIAPERVYGYTVGQALDDYLTEIEARSKSYAETKQKAEQHIREPLAALEVGRLTAARIRKWLNGVAATDSDDPEDKRKRKATANRVLTVLKAALNHAYRDGKVDSDSAWRRVQPFQNVDQPRIRYLTHDEARRLVNAAVPEFRPLLRAALLTGCRYGELAAMVAADYDPDAGTVRVREAKGGPGRHVHLTDEGRQLFDRLTAGKKRGDRMFTRDGGGVWGKSHQHRFMRDACSQAGIDPPIGFHVLRHTYGSMLAAKGVPLQVIARALGHADTRMTERHYAHLQPDYVAEQVRAHLPEFGGGDDDGVVSMRGQP
ncbi:site-specific integrase [Aquisalimonas lutea]|uniref:tyrosine-type recombinase/integrase n=1 Tax=Aquisalimonas lutea TaxID=1327750 RepID=UPI0025B462E5|nr:site-specific integrase [Aquisalimonas lutea]MDN3518324.1 site-specific integrase [Aquisalimonas lutea]